MTPKGKSQNSSSKLQTNSKLKPQITNSSDNAAREPFRRQAQARVLDPLHQARADAGGDEAALGLAVLVDAGLLEQEQVVRLNLVALHAGDFRHGRDLALAAHQTLRLHDHVQRAADLLAQRADRD